MLSFFSISDLKVNGKNLQNEIYVMCIELLCTHQCEVGIYKIDFVAFKEKNKSLKAETDKEAEKPTSFLISAEGSCVPELTSLRKSIHCFWAPHY